jgi:hypothetical protein
LVWTGFTSDKVRVIVEGSRVLVIVTAGVPSPLAGSMAELETAEASRVLVTVWIWVSFRVVWTVIVLVAVEGAARSGTTVMEEVTTTWDSDAGAENFSQTNL